MKRCLALGFVAALTAFPAHDALNIGDRAPEFTCGNGRRHASPTSAFAPHAIRISAMRKTKASGAIRNANASDAR